MFNVEQIAHDLTVAYCMQRFANNGFGKPEEVVNYYFTMYPQFLEETQKSYPQK